MSIRPTTALVTLTLLALTARGSSEPRVESSAPASLEAQSSPMPAMLSVSPSSPNAGPDDDLAAIAQQYPAFGGYFVNDNNELVVLVAKQFNKKPIGDAPRGRAVGLIRKAVLDYVGDADSPVVAEDQAPVKIRDLKVKIVDSEHSFADLQSWRLHPRGMMQSDAISELSIDRAAGQINVTVFTDADLPKLKTKLGQMGIPENSLKLGVGRAGKTATLLSTVRPPMAGIEVRGREGCTIGANVTNGTTSGFLTAGHCSDVEGQTEGTNFYQGRDSNNAPLQYRVGSENSEATWLSSTYCAANSSQGSALPCKDQDVTFVAYSVASNRGRMVKTTESTYSRTIDTTAAGELASYDVTAAYSSTEVKNALNQTLNNVGMRTGFKQAKVVSVDAEVNYGSDVLVHAVKLYSLDGNPVTCSGDSGGPWFNRTGVVNGINTAKLAGIQAGGNTSTPTPAQFATLLPGEAGTINCYLAAYMTPVPTIQKYYPSMTFTR